MRRILPIIVLLAVLGGLAGGLIVYGIWRTAVEQMAPGAEALYAALCRATGLALTGAGHDMASYGLLTIEIVPGFASHYPQLSDGRIRLTSPSLYTVAVHEREELLGRLLRRALSEQLMAVTMQTTAVKAQWLPMVSAFRTWLVFSAAIPLAAEQLVGYIAGTYGIDVMPKLLRGFVQYDDWEELAPAVLGVSAEELERDWHDAMREGVPLRTFH